MSKEVLFGWKIVGLFVVAAFFTFKVFLPWKDARDAAKLTAFASGTHDSQVDWDNYEVGNQY